MNKLILLVCLFLFAACNKECPVVVIPELTCTQKSDLFLGSWYYYKLTNTYKNDTFYRKEEDLFKMTFFKDSGVDSFLLHHFNWSFICNPDTLKLIYSGFIDSIQYYKIDIISEDRIKFDGFAIRYYSSQPLDTFKEYITYDLIKK
jgi:hypothetical protein